jgi:hypothetical protein
MNQIFMFIFGMRMGGGLNLKCIVKIAWHMKMGIVGIMAMRNYVHLTGEASISLHGHLKD